MCLESITKKFDDNNDEMVVAYKIFEKRYTHLKSVFQNRRKNYELGIEYESTKCIIGCGDFGCLYRSGFHAYTSKKDAVIERKGMVRSIKVYEVHLWNLTAVGQQYGRECIVGRKMRITREVSK